MKIDFGARLLLDYVVLVAERSKNKITAEKQKLGSILTAEQSLKLTQVILKQYLK